MIIRNVAAPGVTRLRRKYLSMLNSGEKLSLHALFKGAYPDIADYSSRYRPNINNSLLIDKVKRWATRHKIWLPNGEHYLTCATYLFPEADYQRGIFAVENCAVDYYLNETVGRDVFKNLPPQQQRDIECIIQRMANLPGQFALDKDAAPIEVANYHMLRDIESTSPAQWFQEFLQMYSLHIGITHQDTSSLGLHRVPSVSEYIELRLHTSGMPHILLLIEYAGGQFLDWDWLASAGLDKEIRSMQLDVSLFGALSNDLFSFEKEVIDQLSDTNLVAVYALNHPALTLLESIEQVAGIVQGHLAGYFASLDKVLAIVDALPARDLDRQEHMHKYLDGVAQCVQASWIWQVYTKRYKRPVSLFEETVLA
ncbi:MAG TPA: terpene synthase family protein [Chitinophaga sp.]|uniref:terpene synthase family protein n=1 Tax=Chitinophaga sp. TaxID=1869181 RepID=UPI002C4CA51E|nr:terpene synthase family protein [Chitinophaga sp.]HVI44573.1 terpene synthase family protein [Chitinophaga sp.]